MPLSEKQRWADEYDAAASRHALPRVQPTAEELLDALAAQTFELDRLRERTGFVNMKGEKRFDAATIAAGKSLGPLAWMDGGTLVLRLES